MIRLTIDGHPVSVEAGTSVLEAALQNDIYIPHLCYHPDLPTLSSCRLCLVEVEGMNELQTSCSLEAEDGMAVRTRSAAIDHLRSLAMELILAAHPEHCTSCPKFGRCEMQLLIQYMDATAARMHMRVKKTPKNMTPLIEHEMSRCVLCGRCVRACKDLRGVGVLQYNKSNMETYIGTLHDKLLTDSDCRFCGACAEVCPTGAIRDAINYDATEKRDKLIPCVSTCPAHTEIPTYVRYASEGEYGKANAVIHEKLPFPEALGRVCMHKCEMECRHGKITDSVSIREIKRVCAEKDTELLWKKNSHRLPATGKKVAVVGGGPAGLTAALILNRQGHDVTVFEGRKKTGGQMQYGIPSYRLPRDVVDKECGYVEEAGVKILTEHPVDQPLELRKDYDAVVMAIGTTSGIRLPMEGNSLPGTIICSDFLKHASEGSGTGMGKKICILGGGNVAFDCARTAIRLGAEEVTLACLEARDVMRADDEEITEAQEEGITVLPGRSFEGILGEDHVTGMKLMTVKSFTFDENRRAIIEKEPGSEVTLDVDTVIFAVGQRPALTKDCGFELGRGNTLATTPDSMMTSVDGVFACGDVVTGTRSVVEAIASARNAAREADLYLGGHGDIDETLVERGPHNPLIGRIPGFIHEARLTPEILAPEVRRRNFDQVSCGLQDRACQEASRCLQCDLRFDIHPPRSWNQYQMEEQV